MKSDTEMAQWSRQWRAGNDVGNDAGVAEDLKRRVTRDSRLLKVGLIAPILVTIGIGGGIILRAIRFASPADVVLAFEVSFFILVTWAGSLWLARGTWRPLAETTAAFIDVSIRRCRSNLRAASFGAWLYVCQLSFVVVWKVSSSSIELSAALTAWPVILLGWIGLPVLLAWRSWFVRRQRAKLDRLLEIERQLKATVT